MGCNSTLTDDQLKAMFTATDEDMRQIEQPMECLIERTKHKCEVYQILLQRSCTQATPL